MELDRGQMVQGPALSVKGFGFYPQVNGKTLKTFMEETDMAIFIL